MSRRSDRLYAHHASAADRGSWSVQRDVDWRGIDREAARSRPDLLEHLRAAALIEAYHPVNLGRLMLDAWDDVDAGVVFSLEAHEGFLHFHAIRLYLDAVGHEPTITDAEIVEGRRHALEEMDARAPLLERLVGFMLSEHLAAYFFRRIGEDAPEPVLRDLMRRIAADEVRHAQAASDLVEKRLKDDPGLAPRVLQAATQFRHYGAEMVGDVPVSMPGDAIAIRTFARRVERLCGTRLVDHLKSSL